MEVLSISRADIIQNNVNIMKAFYNDFAFVDKDFYNKDMPVWDSYSYIGVIADYSEDYDKFIKARNLTSSVGYMDYIVESRVHNAEDSTEYLDEYVIDLYMYGYQAILRTDENVQRGETAGYLKWVDEKEYTDSSGFEYTYDVYEYLNEEEVDEYLLSSQICDDYYENVSPVVSTQFYRLIEIVNAYAEENPVNITSKNFAGKYIEINDLTPAEYKNTVEFKENGIVVLNLNVSEGFEEIRATYVYEEYLNRISVEVKMNSLDINDFYFTIDGDKLVYHGEDMGYLSDGIVFIK